MSRLAMSAHRRALTEGRFVSVLNYHNTPESRREGLRRELLDLTAQYRAWTLDDVDRVFTTGRWPDGRPGVLPVFYEGYRASATVAAQVCDELGITGWFAVCTAFVDCPPREQELFARSHRIGLLPEDLAADRLSMTWDQVAELAQRHVVFPHTASHAGIEEVGTPEDLLREVVRPKERMDAVTGRSAPAFAWLHGSPTGVSAAHDEALRGAGYRYLFSNTMLHRL